MFALIVNENKVEREVLAGHLQKAQFRVEVAVDATSAIASIERESPEVVILNWTPAAPDVLRRLRKYDAIAHSYVIALLDKQPPAILGMLLESGADDFVRRPVVREELLARATALFRFRKWAATAGEIDHGQVTGVDFRRLRAYQNLGPLVSEDLSQLLGPLDIVDGWQCTGNLRGASIPLSLAAEETEIRISVVVEARWLRVLGRQMLGDENATAASLEDVLRELANTAGGAIKRAAMQEQVTVTTGLPTNEAPAFTQNDMTRCWTLRLRDTDHRMGIVGEVRKRQNERVPVAKLKEGMVIARDLRSETGALIMPAGTRLTAATVSRIAGLLGGRLVVEVACAA